VTNPSRSRPVVLLVCSSGGHLTQLYNLKPWWERFDRTWVTFDKPDATSLLGEERVVWAYHPTTRNLWNLLRNGVLAWRTIARSRPDVIVSTGAGVAFPFFLIGKLRGARTVYVEVFDRLDSPTMTGRLCAPFSDRFLLQWEEQKRQYPKGEVVGPLL
jgi:UDP-N-acetylglucosamine:LPS N-acetylglucosamine transferase